MGGGSNESIVDQVRVEDFGRFMPFFIPFGFVGVTCNYISYFETIARTSATIDVVFLYTPAIFVTVAASILFNKRITPIKAVPRLIRRGMGSFRG